MRLPVLILPGFASSGMEVVNSDIHESHEKDRVWMNPFALGFGALHIGDAFHKREKTDVADSEPDNVYKAKLGHLSDEQFKSALRCKSKWVQHISLADDKISERGKNKIRPIPGLEGVDFLTNISSMKVSASYVFGPVIEALVEAGYEKGKNVDAAPYDFRIPPCILEQRDQYFTNTMTRIEKMYNDSNELRVVLLCHSLGCKIGHYLLNFAKAKKGQEWIDKHIHTYMPVGAPHIGAPDMITCQFAPETGTPVDNLMSQEEKLIIFRSFGANAWMMPRYLPPRTVTSPGLLCRQEGCLEISMKGFVGDCDALVRTRVGTRDINSTRLYMSYGDKKARSDLTRPSKAKKEKGIYFNFDEKFIFSTGPSLKSGLDTLCVELKEPGTSRAYEREQHHWIREGWEALNIHNRLLNAATEATDTAYSELALSKPINNLHKLLMEAGFNKEKGCHEIDLTIPIYARVDTTLFRKKLKRKARNVEAVFNIKWIPPSSVHMPNPEITPVGELPEGTDTSISLPVVSKEDEKYEYQRVSGQHLLRQDMDETFFNLVQNQYENDQCGPREHSALDAPPVKRVFAIYGINVPTPDGAIFCRPPAVVVNSTTVKQKYKLDDSADIALQYIEPRTCNFGNYEVKSGRIFEVPHKTRQIDLVTGETKYCSGDGTVPYWSLQQVQLWNSENCRVTIEELEGADHRPILADRRFHRLLIQYVGGQKSISNFEYIAAKKLQKIHARLKARKKLLAAQSGACLKLDVES